tara:strand:+ start:644 stop:1981 length:1338 start_codon:yes stop_codon:yes gene_type:complete
MGLLDNTTQSEYYQSNDYGNYQFVSLDDIITQFQIGYVGEDKIISKIKRTDIAFHAQRAMQELSFDTFKSFKAQEITVPATLQMTLPQDYVNYTKISWVDTAGIKHPLYPTNRTSNPTNPLQNSDGDFEITAVGTLADTSTSITLDAEYKNIKVGMIVSGPYIPITPSKTYVASTSNSSSITTVTLEDVNGNAVLPTQSNSGTTLSFKNKDGSLILEKQSSHVVENLSWNVGDYKITGTASELTNIKVGMLVSHDNFPEGTIVTNVYTTTIVTSALPDTAVASGGEVTFISPDSESDTWSNYKSTTPSENNNDDYEDDVYWPLDGERYGLDPQHAQVNGSFYIDQQSGKIHFSSNISGKTVVLDYISDGLGTDDEMQVHKFAEEAMYKSIAYSIMSTRANVPPSQVNRLRRERFAAIRTAKLRLSNIKLEELTQVLRGKSKQIKH